PHLDGVSLLPLIEGQMTAREKPMGFWTYPAKGHPKRSTDILLALQKQQKPGQPNPAGPAPDADAASLETQYSKDELPGAAALVDGNFKLLKMETRQGKPKFTLYDLAKDPGEKQDLSQVDPQRLKKMKAALTEWQHSVVDSLNGKDYAD
ncbi:MAG TPA: N-acetylgalactosamine 6-sulfate sulfatase, partial [Planctomycetaceae bacterium]|nr:N-acetylgalactosamine 6-sulfate sulfatase [Planctomycetaceae bacterium]